MKRRIASLWFEHLPIERILRHRPLQTPFALYWREKNANRIYALNSIAEQAGLAVGMGLGDAQGLCAKLQTAPAKLREDQDFLYALARWSQRYCPWVGLDGQDGIVLDITGSAHLWGGEAGFVQISKADFARLGLSVKIGIAPTRGAAWALAHFDEGITDDPRAALRDLPVTALRISQGEVSMARRLGLRKIGDFYDKPRAEMARRFGPGFLLRLDQALGAQFENIAPMEGAIIFAMRMRFPEPIGLYDDVMAGIERLLEPLCQKLLDHHLAALTLLISLRLVDGKSQELPLRFARPMRVAKEILSLLGHHIEVIDVGFGVDQVRVQALDLSVQIPETISSHLDVKKRKLDDLLTRIGNRVGFENIRKVVLRDRHLPEECLILAPCDVDEADIDFLSLKRPLNVFYPERIQAAETKPPQRFIWRRMKFRTAYSFGPERLAPEWWRDDEGWKKGVRDYWRVYTLEGRRLWLFYTPQNPAWYVQGEFA